MNMSPFFLLQGLISGNSRSYSCFEEQAPFPGRRQSLCPVPSGLRDPSHLWGLGLPRETEDGEAEPAPARALPLPARPAATTPFSAQESRGAPSRFPPPVTPLLTNAAQPQKKKGSVTEHLETNAAALHGYSAPSG